MSINWTRLRSLTARELVNALSRDGFTQRKSASSHRRYIHPDGRRVTVAFHRPGDTFPTDTLRKMIRGTEWAVEDLHRLGLL